jgi:phage baseplate assembly protein W
VINTPHFDYPFRLNAQGYAAEIEQDSLNEIAIAALAVLKTPSGFRLELPEFGIREPALQEGGPSLSAIKTALSTWEPRALYSLDSVDLDALSKLITINTSLLSPITSETDDDA